MAARKRLQKNKDLIGTNVGYHVKGGQMYFYYIHPVTKIKTHWGAVDRRDAINAARKLNAMLFREDDLVSDVIHSKAKEYHFAAILARFQLEALPEQALRPKSLNRKLALIKRLAVDVGDKNIEAFTLKDLAQYLDDYFAGDAYIRARSLFSEVYRFAKRKGLYTGQDNPADDTERKTVPKKKRVRMTKEGYKAIRTAAPEWLQDAMDLALITLQGRYEVVHARFDDEKDGYWHIIREKTKDQTERAFIRFPVGDNLRKLLDRCRKRPILSPFVVAKKPESRNREQIKTKEHWTQILPDYLSKAFQKARDECGFFDAMPPAARPTFHEIRSLGGDMYIEQGYSKEYVNLLYGHTTIKMTEHYLKGHRIAWSECEAALDIERALRG